MYYIGDMDRPGLFWGGDCLFGELKLHTNKWIGPKTHNGLDFHLCGDGIMLNYPPVIPYSFITLEQAKDAIQYVPRKYEVMIMTEELNVGFEIAYE